MTLAIRDSTHGSRLRGPMPTAGTSAAPLPLAPGSARLGSQALRHALLHVRGIHEARR